MSDEGDFDPLDIFSSSLETLYDYQPVTVASAGNVFNHTYPGAKGETIDIKLLTPDTQAANWFLHASDIWASAPFLADNIHLLGLPGISALIGDRKLRLLELGASAGLPSILIAKLCPDISITASDYPDELLIKALSQNILENDVENICRVVPHAWGSDASPLIDSGEGGKFDVVIAADTLWSTTAHPLLIRTLQSTLKPSSHARIHLVAGLHTGRYAIQSFLDSVGDAGFRVETSKEIHVKGHQSRPWSVDITGEDENQERRRWVVWIVLRWKPGITEAETTYQ